MPAPATPIPPLPAAQTAANARPSSGAAGQAFAALIGEATAENAETQPKSAQAPEGEVSAAPLALAEKLPVDEPGVEAFAPSAEAPTLLDDAAAPAVTPEVAAPVPADTPNVTTPAPDLAVSDAAITAAPTEQSDAAPLTDEAAVDASALQSGKPGELIANAADPVGRVEYPVAEAKPLGPASKSPAEAPSGQRAAMISAKSAAEPAPKVEIAQAEAASNGAVDPAAGESASPDPADAAAQILAPFKNARPATERAPGELVRGEMRDARSSPAGADIKPDGKAGMTEPKGEAKPATSPSPASLTPAPATPTAAMPAFELLLGQMEAAADPVLADAPLDPTLTKSDTLFDPATGRLEARAEIRTASTLQYAQGPRLTPQSAQAMAAQIAQRFNEGTRVFDIRMDPPELGRVEVRLEVGSDNSVKALLAAERTETLAELQRSARDLERALAEAGLELGENALTFSMTDEGDGREGFGEDTPDQLAFADADPSLDPLAGPLAPLSTYGFLLARAEGLDVSV